MNPREQQAHDLTILYMQTHTDHWKQNGELDKIVVMYKSIYAEILERLNKQWIWFPLWCHLYGSKQLYQIELR